jgi:hypothetical protein
MKRIVILVTLSVLSTAFAPAALAPAAESGKCCNLVASQAADGTLPGWKSFHEGDAKTGDVWKLTDDGVLVSKGSPKGYLFTDKDYDDFVLELEWRWPEGKKPGNGGVLIRTTGPDKIWPKCLEAQINAGSAGDLVAIDGFNFTGDAGRTKKIDHPKFGKLIITAKAEGAEKPAGQWNSYRITADRGQVTLEINGKVVNRATDCDLTPGKILLTAEGDEIHFRNVRLSPLDPR